MSEPFIIVPVVNGADSIESFLGKVPTIFKDNLVFVNDGSSDNTEDILNNHQCKVINHKINKGKGAAIHSSLEWIKNHHGKVMITIDVDLQHDPHYLEKFTQISNRTINLGYRFNRKTMPFLRQISNFITSLIISIRSGTVIKDSQCGFRSFNVKLFDNFSYEEKGFQFESEILIKASLLGWKVNHIKIPTIYGNEKSEMNHFSDTFKFIILWLKSYLWT